MNKLTELFMMARKGLSYYDRTPESVLMELARQCRASEVAAIHIRLKMFHAEMAMTPDWDGDTHDLIWDAIEEHKKILGLIARRINSGAS